jgi:hypothetical protein
MRRPLLLMVVLGFGISIISSGRFTLRLIVDGALSFAFAPVCELAAFAVVYSTGRRTLPFAKAVDRFFAGNTPWLWWLFGIMLATAVLPVRQHGHLLPALLVACLLPIAFSIAFDLRFMRDVMGRTRGRARVDIVVQRIIAWSAATAYFFGLASSPRTFLYLFVEIRDTIAWSVAELFT